MQRDYEPIRKRLESWQRSELTDITAKVVIYDAFVEGKLEALKLLTHTVHDLYFSMWRRDLRGAGLGVPRGHGPSSSTKRHIASVPGEDFLASDSRQSDENPRLRPHS